jgi:hypothetical protein
MNDPAQAITSLPAPAARMLAVEILLADPEALQDDCLESCLYVLREKLRAAAEPDKAPARQDDGNTTDDPPLTGDASPWTPR